MTDAAKLKVVHTNSKWLNFLTRTLVILIAAGAGILSFDGLAQLAAASGIRTELSYVWALVIDGFILVATFATYTLKDRSAAERNKQYYAWFVLAIFVIISIFGNALHILPGQELPLWIKIGVSSIPPIAFFLAGHLLIIMLSPTVEEKQQKVEDEKRQERDARALEKKLEAQERRQEREARILEKKLEAEERRADRDIIAADKPIPTPATPRKVSPARPKRDPVTEPKPELVTFAANAVNLTKPPRETTPAAAPDAPTLSETPQDEPLPIQTKDEALEHLIGLLVAGEALPSSKTVGAWVGLKERSGATIIKKAREAVEEMHETTSAR